MYYSKIGKNSQRTQTNEGAITQKFFTEGSKQLIENTIAYLLLYIIIHDINYYDCSESYHEYMLVIFYYYNLLLFVYLYIYIYYYYDYVKEMID